MGLTQAEIRKLNQPGKHAIGGGLYLRVNGPDSKTWILRISTSEGRKEATIGRFPEVDLPRAKRLARTERNRLESGVEALPSAPRKAVAALRPAGPPFADCVTAYIEAHRAEWSDRHAAGWAQTMAAYAAPVIGALSPSAVTTDLVMDILRPIWTAKPETAGRVRGRIEAVLDWAAVHNYRQGDNPARWKGHLEHLLSARGKVAAVRHHEALPYRDMPALAAALEDSAERAAPALLFTILTATRSGEARGARLEEIDLGAAVWTIPAQRMKAGREHRVPLSAAGLRIVAEAAPRDGLLFPASRGRGATTGTAFHRLLDSLGYGALTVHGFRSTFRDWAAEETDFPNEVAEMALAHAVGNKVEAAYRRGDLFEKRRLLMEAWARWCGV